VPVKPAPRESAEARAPTLIGDAVGSLTVPRRASGEGVLALQAEPFGDVFLEGRPYGEAPREFRLKAGSYRAAATHPQLGRREVRIDVKAGERTRWTADFLSN
jgi:hypothetical protein